MTTKQVTGRQQTVLDGLKAGKTPQDIAAEMNISVNGVYGHMRRLRKAGLIENGSRKRGRRRASTSRRRASSNGSRRNGQEPNRIVEAIDAAHAQGKARIAEIESEIEALQSEKDAITNALA